MYKMLTNFEKNKINAKTCRSCLKTNNENVSIKYKSELSQLFEFCVGVTVDQNDTTQVLCLRCATVIKKYSDFKMQCLKSDKILKSIENNINNICKEKLSTIEAVNITSCDTINLIENEFSNNKKSIHNSNTNITKSQSNERIEENSSQKSRREKNYKNSTEEIMYEENINYSNNEYGKGRIKVLECFKCKKQYQKFKCLIKHMKQTCFKHNNIQNAVVNAKDRPPSVIEKKEKRKKNSSDFFCGICRFSSPSHEDMVIHLSEHWKDNDLSCKLCSYVGEDLAELFGHRSVHQPYAFFSKTANRICHICDASNLTIKTQQFHYRSVHLNKDGGLCSVCRKTFRSYVAWRDHERLHKEGKYICDLCGKKFLFRCLIKSHLEEHANKRDSICHICGKAFKRASYLRVHFNTVHTKEPVKCTHCNKTFKSPPSLRDHLKYVTKEKKFQCDICLKYYVSEHVLKNHKFWHTDIRPFSCKDCGMKFKAKSYLKVHMRKHTGQRPFSCDQCDKCFPTSMQLKRHRMVHSGELPYKCTNCNRSFYYKKRLLSHINLKHKVEINQL